MATNIEQLQSYIDQSKRIVFFGGAGVSTASGIPDFRSSNGLFVKEMGYNVSAEEIVSIDFFQRFPKIFFDFYFKHLVYEQAEPNLVHRYIAQLENKDKHVAVVTQNIDGLHERAGSSLIYNLHGSVSHNHCTVCSKPYELSELVRDEDGIPRCPDDGGIIKPDVVLYGEMLDMSVMQGAIEEISRADLLVIIGTSLAVYPAAGLVDYFNGKHVVVVNQSSIPTHHTSALVLQEDMNKVFKQLH